MIECLTETTTCVVAKPLVIIKEENSRYYFFSNSLMFGNPNASLILYAYSGMM